MKTYRAKGMLKIFFNLAILIITIALPITVLFLWYRETLMVHRIFAILMIILGVSGIYVINNTEFNIDDEKVETVLRLGKKLKKKTLLWSEVGELDSGYVLFPEGGFITLKPKVGLSKKPVHIPLDGMPIELLKDILSHLPPDTKVYLYPYLKRKVEGKQTWFYIK